MSCINIYSLIAHIINFKSKSINQTMKGYCFAMESTSFIKLSLISSVILMVVLNQMHGYKACLKTERAALSEIKSFFIPFMDTQYEDPVLVTWVDDGGMSSDCCDWKGVRCNATTGRVIQLLLNDTSKFIKYSKNYTYGYMVLSLNVSLFHPFEELQSLDLSNNSFEGVYENQGMYRYISPLNNYCINVSD